MNEYLTNHHFRDLNPIHMGAQSCPPGHCYGPHIRKNWLIHYIKRGSGMFYARGGAYPVHVGEAFLIRPDEVTTYIADTKDPWEYAWIGFDGQLAERFRELPPVFPLPAHIFEQLQQQWEGEGDAAYRLAAGLFCLYDVLFSTQATKRDYVQEVLDYVRINFWREISVEDMAAQMHIDRGYLSRLFKHKTGQTVQSYIIQTRLTESTRLMQQGYSVQEAAQLCGYEDPAGFSRMFKRKYGVSPTAWKRMKTPEDCC